MRNTLGFTIVNLIISLAVFAILSTIILVAIDPASRIQEARDTRRRQDVVALAKAFKDYSLNHQGQLPLVGDISNRKRVLCSNMTRLTCGDDADACLEIDTSTDFLDSYLPTLPIDPSKTNAADSGYYIEGDPSTGQITIGACSYDQAAVTNKPKIKATVLDCGTAGIAYNGSCWYIAAAAAAVNCTYVCSAGFSLTCDGGVTPTVNSCELNRQFGVSACGACSNTTGAGLAYSPGIYTLTGACYEDSQADVCNGSTSAYGRPICPCY